MLKKLNFLLLFGLIPTIVFSQPIKELTDTKPHDNEAAWNSLKSDYSFVWGNTDTRYPKLSIPNKTGMENKDGNTSKIFLKGWRGEEINAQALLYTKINLNHVSLSISDLKNGSNIIPASIIKIQPVYYVMTDELNKDGKGGCGHRPDPTKYDSSIVADILDHQTNNLSIEPRTTRPVWLTLNIPVNARPGKYKGTITANVPDKKNISLQIELTVANRMLPPASQWPFHLDLWQDPFSVARYNNLPLWSKEHFDKMRLLMKILANAGQKIITASIMHEPWAAQTYDGYTSMITRTKNLDGSWEYNYDVFDKWVSFMMDEVGITDQINCYTMIPWALNFDYFDRATNTVQFVKANPGSAAYRDYWLPFLKDFSRHLKAKNWFQKTTIAMDERPMKDMQEAIKIIKEADAGFKVSLAGNYHEEIQADIYDYCIAFGQNFPEQIKTQREAQGKRSTVYTCCTEVFPNTFTFSAPAEATWIGWHTAAGNYDGYLRWAYNSWTKDPLKDSRFRSWAAGDTYLVYPEARSSIRFQRLKEGIQDFEKIQMLRAQYKNDPKKLKALNEAVATFTLKGKGNQTTDTHVRNARKILNGL